MNQLSLYNNLNSVSSKWSTPIPPFPRLSAAKTICIDLETYDPNLKSDGPGYIRQDGYILGLAVGTEDNQWYFPLRHKNGDNCDINQVWDWARKEFNRPEQSKVFTNALYDLGWLRSENVHVTGKMYDVMIAERLLKDDEWPSLQKISNHWLNESKNDNLLYEWLSVAYGGAPTRTAQGGKIHLAPANIVGPYAVSDVDLPIRALSKQIPALEQKGLMTVFNLECDLIPMLLDMRFHGVRVDMNKTRELNNELSVKIKQSQTQLDNIAGFSDGISINVNAQTDLCKLFDKHGIPYDKGTKSFSHYWLVKQHCDITDLIVNIRKYQLFKRTFTEGYILNQHRQGRIYPMFNQIGAETGRFSSSHPNLQNIPTRDKEFGPLMRGLFIPEDNEQWVKFDYSQIEYRYLVHCGKDPVATRLKQKFIDNPDTDIHTEVAQLAGLNRKDGKTLNFGIVYGLGKQALATQLGRTVESAEELKTEYNKRFPFAKELSDMARNTAQTRGYVRTLLGRRRSFNRWEPAKWGERKQPLPYDQAKETYGNNIRRAYTYKALNSAISGSAADIFKMAMKKVYDSGVLSVTKPPLLLVHDELDFSIPKTPEGKEAINIIKEIMESAVKLSLPLIVDVETGSSWALTD